MMDIICQRKFHIISAFSIENSKNNSWEFCLNLVQYLPARPDSTIVPNNMSFLKTVIDP